MADTLILRNGSLLLTDSGLLKIYNGEGAPPLDCCCSGSGSGGSGGDASLCCFLSGSETLFITVESSCAAIDGSVVTLTQFMSGRNWLALHATLGTPECMEINFALHCDNTVGEGQPITTAWIMDSLENFDPCGLTLNSPNPVSLSCDPFELVFTATVVEVGPTCTCCTVGAAVTLRITR